MDPDAPGGSTPASTTSITRALVRTARPHQWVKNLLVVAAPVAAGVIDEWWAQWRTLVAFVAFSLVASGTYFLNDAADVDADRSHPHKRHRPVASGQVAVRTARVVGVGLLVAGVAVGAATGEIPFVVTLVAYVVLTVSYSTWLKHVAVIELVAVALGFVLRAVGGATATGVEASVWFLVTTSFGSLMVVTGKRHHEFEHLREQAVEHRRVLGEYTLPFLRTVLTLAAAATAVAYCLWAFEAADETVGSWPLFEVSAIPVVTALLRYTLLVETGHGGAPEEVFVHDRTLLVLAGSWAVLFMAGVYAG